MKANILMKYFTLFSLAALLLTLNGCGETANSKTEAAASAVTAVAVKELTPEEKFLETKKKAEAGDPEAQNSLGEMYTKGGAYIFDASGTLIFAEDHSKALEWFQKAATQGHAMAQFRLGIMYEQGAGTPKDMTKAIFWYQKSASQNNPNAQVSLGYLYREGKNVPKDTARAFDLFQKAASNPFASDAQYALGYTYANGIGVPKNMTKAIEWFQKAAELGYADAQEKLTALYTLGEGIPKDEEQAAEWWKKAAAQGNIYAQTYLGKMYLNGKVLPKDDAKAFDWLQKAAAQGGTDAQANLGMMYYDRRGVGNNIVFAYAWINLASSIGHGFISKDKVNAIKSLRDNIELELTQSQRAEGQRLASNWKKGDILQSSNDSAAVSTSPDVKPSKQATGTAFVVSSEGHALTNHHVINGCAEVKIAGREGVVKVITSDSVNDLALLQFSGKVNDIATLNPDLGKLRQGDDIIVFGYPLNWVLSSGGNLTPGTISALTGMGNNTNQIQITAPIQPGSSGSPVMDKKGNVVGVVSMKLSDTKMVKSTGSVGQNVNFAVNGQTVKSFLDANKVPYKTGGGFFSREKGNADIAEEARKSTMLVECWK